MSNQELPRTYRRVPLGGLVILFLGIVFLLQTLDVLPWALWGTLWRFWPVLIVAVGLGILLGRQNPWLVGVLILSLLFACLGLAIWQYEQVPEPVIERYSEPLANLEHVHIEMDFNGGSLSLSSLENNSLNFVEIDSEARRDGVGLKMDFTEYDGEGTLYLSTEGVSRLSWVEPWVDCEVRLTRDIPLELNIDSAASNLDLDLSELRITELRMNMDAGNYKITAPSSTGEVFIKLDASAANVEVIIPDGVAARIRADTNLCGFDIDESHFPRSGDYYVSDDFTNNENCVELEVDCNVGSVEVK